jgi:hypothetical protein
MGVLPLLLMPGVSCACHAVACGLLSGLFAVRAGTFSAVQRALGRPGRWRPERWHTGPMTLASFS